MVERNQYELCHKALNAGNIYGKEIDSPKKAELSFTSHTN